MHQIGCIILLFYLGNSSYLLLTSLAEVRLFQFHLYFYGLWFSVYGQNNSFVGSFLFIKLSQMVSKVFLTHHIKCFLIVSLFHHICSPGFQIPLTILCISELCQFHYFFLRVVLLIALSDYLIRR